MLRFQRVAATSIAMAQMPEVAAAMANYLRSTGREIADGECVEIVLRRNAGGILEARESADADGGALRISVTRKNAAAVCCDVHFSGRHSRFLLATNLIPEQP